MPQDDADYMKCDQTYRLAELLNLNHYELHFWKQFAFVR